MRSRGWRDGNLNMMVRDANADDLEAVVALAQRRRAELALWQPQYWRPAAEADVLHRMWLDYLISSATPTRVVDDEGAICAFAGVVDQGGQWFIDDLAVAASRWPDAGVALLSAIPEQPALICVPFGDADAHLAADAAGVEWVSSYWLQPVDPVYPANESLEVSADTPDEAVTAPPHTMRSANPDAIVLSVWHGTGSVAGSVVASPPVPSPPVYDPGGTTCVIDRVVGDNRGSLLRAAVRTAFDRGDVQVPVVAGSDDAALLDALGVAGWRRAVDIAQFATTSSTA